MEPPSHHLPYYASVSPLSSRKHSDSPYSCDGHSLSSQQQPAYTPKLGDFSKLHSSVRSSPSLPAFSTPRAHPPRPTSSIYSENSTSETPITLGNFSRLFQTLHQVSSSSSSRHVSPTPPSPMSSKHQDGNIDGYCQPPTAPRKSINFPCIFKPISLDTLEARQDMNQLDEVESTAYSSTGSSRCSSPTSTPPSSYETSPATEIATAVESLYIRGSYNDTGSGNASGSGKTLYRRCIIKHQQFPNGPVRSIEDWVRTREDAYESLTKKLTQQQALDQGTTLHKDNVENNVHVFFDMSNIYISFMNAVRNKYKIAKTDHFVGLPQLNLHFLHELIIRGRPVKGLNVGCSMHPDRSEPAFVQTFRDLGYVVDLRHRRLAAEHIPIAASPSSDNNWYSNTSGSDYHTGSSGDETSHHRALHPTRANLNNNNNNNNNRYVEDMVDETLQVRIYECLSEHFDFKGTIVIVTGDAQPAKFSQGFLKCAEAALKYGFNIEVVSWKHSRSSLWLNSSFSKTYGDRFRIIELDPYLDELFDNYV